MPNPVPDPSPLLTLKEAAKLLKQSVRTLRTWIKHRPPKITSVKIGKQYRIKRTTIDELIEQHTIEAGKNGRSHPRQKKPVRKATPPKDTQESDVG